MKKIIDARRIGELIRFPNTKTVVANPEGAHVETETVYNVLVWFSQNCLLSCGEEASRSFPFETGGTFMGWWADRDTAVITSVIGPGPKASHGRHHFQPDQEWQIDQIAKHYEASGRRETYLGDWHSHPNAISGTLSWTDRRVLRRIINTDAARCSTPLMSVFWGKPDDWEMVMWHSQLRQRSFLWDQLTVTKAALKLTSS